MASKDSKDKAILEVLETSVAEPQQSISENLTTLIGHGECFADNDPESPYNWPRTRKWPIVACVGTLQMISIFATTTIVPAAPQAIASLNVRGDVAYRTLLVSIWELGEGLGPFLSAPLSERYGRLPVYHLANVLGVLCAVATAMSVNISMLVAFRFFGGFVSAIVTLASAIVGDIYRPEQRGLALSIQTGLALTGTFVAPVCGAFVAQALGWRWTIWIVAIAIVAVGGLSIILVRETYGPAILLKRQQAKRGSQYKEASRQRAINAVSIWAGVARPLRKLFSSPTVFLITCYGAYAYAIGYLILTTLTEIMEVAYQFSRGVVGLAFLAPATGYLIGTAIYALTSDRYIAYVKKRENGILKPEHRLTHMLIGATILPLGLLLYGWTLAYRVQFIVPLFGSVIVGAAMMLSTLSMNNYLVDAFGIHSASAVGAGVMLRALFATVLPLAGPPIYAHLGLGWGNSLLALISAAFVPALSFFIKTKKKAKPSATS